MKTDEEKLKDLMNKISLVLKDATLQQGFEIICKKLLEAEKENTELKAQIEQLSNDNHVLKTSFITQQAQIEKMKCCENCKHHKIDYERRLSCKIAQYFKTCDKWEPAE